MAMTSGTPVKSGYYFNSKRWSFARVEKDGDALPGGCDARWTRVPAPVVFAAAPVLGGLFVVAMPLLGAAAIGVALARRFGAGVKDGATELAATLAAGPVAGEAHLTGKPGAAEERAPKAPAPELDELGAAIEEKRRK